MHLLDVAIAVAKAAGGLEETYFWVSEERLLFLRNAPDRRFFQAVYVEAGTGVETPLEEFNRRFGDRMLTQPTLYGFDGGHSNQVHYHPPHCALSPDGRWLLWYRSLSPFLAARLDASDLREWPADDRRHNWGVWCSDSSGWVQLVREPSESPGRGVEIRRARIHSLDASTPTRIVNVSGLWDGWPAGATPSGQVLLCHCDAREQGRAVDLSLLEVVSDTAAAASHRVELPEGMGYPELRLSPEGERLAWLFSSGLRPEEENLHILAFSDARGEQMREVSELQGHHRRKGQHPRYDGPRELRWTPDGGRVSFVFDGVVWAVAAG